MFIECVLTYIELVMKHAEYLTSKDYDGNQYIHQGWIQDFLRVLIIVVDLRGSGPPRSYVYGVLYL